MGFNSGFKELKTLQLLEAEWTFDLLIFCVSLLSVFHSSGTKHIGLACRASGGVDKVDISRGGEHCAAALLEYSWR